MVLVADLNKTIIDIGVRCSTTTVGELVDKVYEISTQALPIEMLKIIWAGKLLTEKKDLFLDDFNLTCRSTVHVLWGVLGSAVKDQTVFPRTTKVATNDDVRDDEDEKKTKQNTDAVEEDVPKMSQDDE